MRIRADLDLVHYEEIRTLFGTRLYFYLEILKFALTFPLNQCFRAINPHLEIADPDPDPR